MARTGDWLIPRVNGLPRYDKPPLVYWLMGLTYALPGQPQWDPLGTWAARLPSALSTVALMLVLASTLLRWPQALASGRSPSASQAAITAITAALAFALSPLVLIWSRVAVSDALLTGLLGVVLLLFWRCYAGAGRCWLAWVLLGLAVLAKGPGGCGVGRDHPDGLRSLAKGSERFGAAAAALARAGDHGCCGSALVWPGGPGGRAPLYREFLRLSQPAAFHRGGEQPPAALVVFLAGAAGGGLALHAAAAGRPEHRRAHGPGSSAR